MIDWWRVRQEWLGFRTLVEFMIFVICFMLFAGLAIGAAAFLLFKFCAWVQA